MAAKRTVDRILDGIDVGIQVVCIALLSIVTFAVTWQVISRYVVVSSSAWTSEAASYAFVWLAMLAIPLGIRRGRHMVLDIWEYLPYRRWVVRTIDTVAAVIVVGVLLLLVYFGFEALGPAFRRTAPGLGIPFGWVALAVPVGSLLATVFAVEAWWRLFNAAQDEDPLDAKLLYQPDDVVVIKGEL